MTTLPGSGSRLVALGALVGLAACEGPAPAQARELPRIAEPAPRAPVVPAVSGLRVKDSGIFSDLDDRVELTVPAGTTPASSTATVDRERELVVLYVDGWPAKVYPLGGPRVLRVGDFELALADADHAELATLLRPGAVRSGPVPDDRDGDGIPDPLDVTIGARKTALNGARYEGGYLTIPYPGGDVPRELGVCTDVIIRAVRNAGLDLQAELQRDIRRARRAYPMVKRPNANIDHRRVKTLLPYFVRRWEARSPRVDDPADPLRPGDIVFMDTFPSRPGPDHVGVVSDRLSPDGMPLVVNNWTDGSHTGDMELLSWVPVTHRFRISASTPPR